MKGSVTQPEHEGFFFMHRSKHADPGDSRIFRANTLWCELMANVSCVNEAASLKVCEKLY